MTFCMEGGTTFERRSDLVCFSAILQKPSVVLLCDLLQAAKVRSSLLQDIGQLRDTAVDIPCDYAQGSAIVLCWCFELVGDLLCLV